MLEGDSRPLATPVKMFHRHYKQGFTNLIFKTEEHYRGCVNHYNLNFGNGGVIAIDKFEGDLSVFEGVRYFNKREMERLQTMPIDYTEVLTINECASVLGNGWTVDVVTHIFKNI